ncbi:protein kinase [Actinoplanes bogorensis]|uniref:Protein kinase n=1 Tax=Paractinoplanes bogorensis TaxID=1610840 RepID=A0ABS5YKV0_9ACTN|nr:protein kinase [Actinoplanes bogorensis]MBU2664090.1 protein kinase [Actinoplanes bogorensis]
MADEEWLGADYRLHEVISQGALAVVRRATARNGGPELAATLFRPELAGDEQVREAFARSFTWVLHPAVVEVRGLVAEPLALVTELVDGVSLRRWLTLNGGTRPAAEAVHIAGQIAAALAAAHERTILHLNLTPATVQILRGTQPPVVKVSDFGVSALLIELGVVAPAPAYAAPEIRSGGLATPAADVYSLGVLTAEIISGVRPESARSDLSGLPPSVVSVVRKMLADEPWSRPSAAGVAAQFRSLAGQLAPALPVASPAALSVDAPAARSVDAPAARSVGAPAALSVDAPAAGSEILDGQVVGFSGSPVVGPWVESDDSWVESESVFVTSSVPGPATPGPGTPLGRPGRVHAITNPPPAPRRRLGWSRTRTVIASSAATLVAATVLAVNLDAGANDQPIAGPTVSASPSAAVSTTVVTPPPVVKETLAQPAAPKRGTYAAHLPDKAGTLYVGVRDGVVVSYMCDGKRIEAWFHGTAANGSVSAKGKNGQLTGVYTSAGMTGQVTVKGKTYAYDIPTVTKPSALYRASSKVRNAKVDGAWIVLPNGEQVGVLTVGETTGQATFLNTTSNTTVVSGTTVTAKKFDVETGVGF